MKLIEVAWIDYQVRVIPLGASKVQRTESRRAFYAGAKSLFESILGMLEPGEEATEADLSKMDDINNELEQFSIDVKKGEA